MKKWFLYLNIFLSIILIALISKGVSDEIARKVDKTDIVIVNEKINSEYEQRLSMFESFNTKNPDIVFLGDSITEKCNWDEYFPEYKIANRGIGADTTTGVLNRLDNIIKLNPKKVFIMIGINDLTQGNNVDTIIGNYESIIGTLNNEIPNTSIYIQSVLPLKGTEAMNELIDSLNIKISELASKFDLTYIDINSKLKKSDTNMLDEKYTADNVHLKGNAYIIWIDTIKDYVK